MKQLAAALVLLSGCSDFPRARTESEIRQIAEDVADASSGAKVRELESQIEELEDKIRILEAENRLQKAEIDVLKAGNKWQDDSVDRLFKNDKIFSDRLGIPMKSD